MSISGFEIHQELIKKYEELRFEKTPQGILLKIQDENLVLEDCQKNSFDYFVENLPEAEPRFLLYDFPIKNRIGLDDTRILFLFWMPLESPVRLRMQYAGTKSLITTYFQGISTQIQTDSKADLKVELVTKKMAARQGTTYQQQ